MRSTLLVVTALVAVTPASAQRPPDPQALIAAQTEALGKFGFLDGVWRGPAWTMSSDGKRREIVQTERIGPFLGGTVRVIEGRGYGPDGKVGFNALGIVSFDPETKGYSLRSYALGRHGDFPFELTSDGYKWQTPAGPNAVIRYTATVSGGKLREVGYLSMGDHPPVQVFEMNLVRAGGTDWPGGDAVPMK
jgi:hypothetical protein